MNVRLSACSKCNETARGPCYRVRMRDSTVLLIVAFLPALSFGCGGAPSRPEAPNGGTKPEPLKQPAPNTTGGTPSRRELTVAACEASGGVVVGDIGDGAIHRADYRCPSGAEPSGNIRATEGGPMGVEGS